MPNKKIGCYFAYISLILIILIILISGCTNLDLPLNQNSATSGYEISVVFLGDSSFQHDYLGSNKCNFIKNEFDLILHEADYAIANLEAPITIVKESPFSGIKPYIYSESVTDTPVLLKDFSIDAVSLANNHTMDYEFEGLKETMYYLNQNEILFFGAGNNNTEASEPLHISFNNNKSINLFIIAGFEYRKSYDFDYSFYADSNKGGVSNLSDEKTIAQIEEIRLKEPNSIIIIYAHWGNDYQWKTDNQVDLSRKYIAAGADIIVGHGSHIIQEIEYINGNLVVYGIGNFIFTTSGRYKSKNAAPYSFIARMIIFDNANNLNNIKIRLYPIVTDNLLTGYKPRFATEQEADEVFQTALDKSKSLRDIEDKIQTGEDAYGQFLELPYTDYK